MRNLARFGSRPRGETAVTSIATVGNLRVRGECVGGTPALFIYLPNLATGTGTMNALLTDQTASDGPVALHTVGRFVGAGAEVTLDHFDTAGSPALATGNFNRVEGQLVFQTPGRVTTINFHAFVGIRETAGASSAARRLLRV